MEGFLVSRWLDRWQEGVTAMATWIQVIDNNISPGVPGEQVVGQVAGGSDSHGYLDTG